MHADRFLKMSPLQQAGFALRSAALAARAVLSPVRRPVLMALVWSAWCLAPMYAAAQVATDPARTVTSEERVKAASLYKFLNYVEWPETVFATTDTPYVIGVLAADAVAGDLDAMVTGRNIQNRAVTVKRLRALEPLTGIHVLFIGNAERSRMVQLVRELQSAPVLVVTESDGAIGLGSMINFRRIDERVRFEVALEPAEKAGLRLNSRLLAVALSVSKGGVQ